MKLLRLDIKNFKGIDSFSFEPNGNNADIYGENATGKTSILDAFTWLLTDKDSQNASQFTIKPKSGLKKGAQVEVEGVFDLNGETLTLKKVYAEVWTKKRGSATREFTGHTTDYFINGVPAKLKGYNEKLNEIADPSLFRMLTNLRYVNEEMHWQDRRKLLIDVCGDVKDADIIDSDPSFGRIPEIIGTGTVDDCRAKIEYTRKGINKELQAIPTRIDELQKSLSLANQTTDDIESLNRRKSKLKDDLSELQDKKTAIESGGAVAFKKKEILEVENRIDEIERERKQAENAAIQNDLINLGNCRAALEEAEYEETRHKAKLDEIKADINAAQGAIENLRNQWQVEFGKVFMAEDVCPTCGQSLPKEQIEEARKKFNTAKAARLVEITHEGGLKVEALDYLKKTKDQAEIGLNKAKEKTSIAKKSYESAKAETTKQPKVEYPEKELGFLLGQRVKLDAELSELQLGTRDETADIQAEIEPLESQIEGINTQIAAMQSENKTRVRIASLEVQEKELAAEYERLEGDLALLENFVRAKCDMLTDRINSKFKLVKWVLFENQINGGLKDICTAMFDGVPYPDLNNAMKIRCGADIISTLQNHSAVTMPVFVDNKEAIVGPIEMNCQTINLIVSEKDKKLRVEIEKEKTRKAA